jgi:hypothetical protein
MQVSGEEVHSLQGELHPSQAKEESEEYVPEGQLL